MELASVDESVSLMELSSIHPLLVIGIGVLVLVNVVVTVGLIKDVGTTPFQKVAQGFIIWLIPFLGAGVILAVIGSHHSQKEMQSLVPFPFYLAAYQKPDWRESPSAEGSGGSPAEGSCGEGSCGE